MNIQIYEGTPNIEIRKVMIEAQLYTIVVIDGKEIKTEDIYRLKVD